MRFRVQFIQLYIMQILEAKHPASRCSVFEGTERGWKNSLKPPEDLCKTFLKKRTYLVQWLQRSQASDKKKLLLYRIGYRQLEERPQRPLKTNFSYKRIKKNDNILGLFFFFCFILLYYVLLYYFESYSFYFERIAF